MRLINITLIIFLVLTNGIKADSKTQVLEYLKKGNNLIFISATFKGKKDNKLNIRSKMNSLIEKKKKDQPTKIKTCGSTFKNPENNKAWKLIKILVAVA